MAWQQKLRRTVIIIQVSLVILAVAAYFVVRSAKFHEFLRNEIQKEASEALGAEVQLRDFTVHLSRLTADAYGITIRGKEPVSARPLAQADQLGVRVKIISLLRKKVELNEIVLRHPVVNLQVSDDGTTNLPATPKSKSSTNPFDLGIQHVLLERGEVYYNDVRTPMDAELHDLRLEIKAEVIGKAYDGKVSYRHGRVVYGGTNPLPHDLAATFKATPSEFTLNPVVLSVASSRIEFHGQLRNYSQPSASGSYRITVHPQDAKSVFAPNVTNASIPSGEVILTGSLRYQQRDGVPPIRALTMDGVLSGRELTINTADLNTVVRNIDGQFRLANGNLDVHGFQADLLGGHVTATATMQHLDANSVGNVHASMQSISLTAVNAALRSARLDQTAIGGQINGTTDAAWTGSVKNINARSDVNLSAVFTGGTARSARVPIEGAVHLKYDGRSETATLTNTSLHSPRTRLEIDGTAGQKLNLRLQAHATDLTEFNTLAAAFRRSGPESSSSASAGLSPESTNFGGAADLQMLVQGTTNDPRIQGQLVGRNLQAGNTQWRSLELKLQASKSGISIENGSLVNARQGYVHFAAGTGLENWHYVPSSPINLDVSSRGIAIGELLQLARLEYPITGDLSVDVSMHGSQLSPTGKGLIQLTQANVYGQPVQQISIQSEGNGEALTSSVNVSSTAGSAKADLVFYPKRKGYEVQLQIPGIDLAQVQAIKDRNARLAGVLTASANGRGTTDDPQLRLSAQIPQLQVHDANISGIKTDVKLANHQAELVVDSEVAQTSIQARATVNLSDGHYTRATLDTKGVPLEGLLALRGPTKSNGPRGVVEVHASAEGPLDDKDRMNAQLVIPTLKAEYQGLQIGNTGPIRVHYANSIIALDPSEISGTDTTLKLQGQLPLRGNAPVTLSAVGSVDMQLVRLFQSDLQTSGKLQIDVRGTGPTDHPSLKGQLRLQNVAVIPADSPLGLQNVNGVLDVSNDQITITQLAGESGGGQVTARGSIGYRPQLQMNVVLQAKNVRFRYQDAIRSVMEGDLNLVGTREAANLNGRVLIDSLKFTHDFDLATLAGQVQSGPESAVTPGLANNIKLDIGVETARDINVTSSAVSLQGQANLRVIGTAADPVIVGRTEFTAGDIFLMNKRYQIERGIVEFSNPNRTEPVLNLRLTTTINQYNLSLTFLGPLDKMQTSYVSDPPLPTADIINLIARGQTSQQAATSTSELGATSLLAQGAASQLSGGIQKLAGLSSLSIDPTLGGNNTDPGARIAMQKRITNNFLFTFATDVTSAQREIIQGEYKFNKRWSASVTRDENGGFAVDGKFHKRY